MARDGSGTYNLPAGYAATDGQTATAAQHNDPLEDMETALNDAPLKGYSATITANWTFSGNPVFTGSPNFSGVSNKSAIRTALGLEIGADVQAYDAQLASLAALSSVSKLTDLQNNDYLPWRDVSTFNMNNVVQNGFIFGGTGVTNIPASFGSSFFNGLVMREGDNDLAQLIIDQPFGRLAWRARNAGTWGDWQQAVRTGDVPDDDDLSNNPGSVARRDNVQAAIDAAVGESITKTIAVGTVTDGNFTVGFDEGCTITRAGTGDYLVSFDSAEPDTDYVVFASLGVQRTYSVPQASKTVNSFSLKTYVAGGSITDTEFDVKVERLR